MKDHWIEGSPKEKGNYWLSMHDQGGHPFVVVAYLVEDLKEDLPPLDGLEAAKAAEAGTYKDRLEMWVTIPELKAHKPLRQVWNIDRHLKLEKPEP